MSKHIQTTQFPSEGTTAGYFVYRARIAKGYSQQELSDITGVSTKTINRIERDKLIKPRKSTLDLLFAALDIQSEYYEMLLEPYDTTVQKAEIS